LNLYTEEEIEMLKSVGGKIAINGNESYWNFGWISSEERSEEQTNLDATYQREMPSFSIEGEEEPKDRAFLWDFSLKANNGKHFTVFHQQTGSCVGNGLGQALWYLSAVEVHRLKDPEQVLMPFWLLPYGRSRMYAGMDNHGEGSFGSSAALAISKDGVIPFNLEGLPQPTNRDGLTWGKEAELEWSRGSKIDEKWLNLSRKHLVKTTARIRSADDAIAALRNYYPLTCASMFGFTPMIPEISGTPPVRVVQRRNDSWGHQMCCIGWIKHPEHGDIFYILNSWGKELHGVPAGSFNEPPGGFWIKKKEMEFICRDEVFAFSQFQGFPAQTISWNF
jgi:hypothetical protein